MYITFAAHKQNFLLTYFHAVRHIRLNDPCSVGDQCDDMNAACSNNVCLCQRGYYEQQQRCGQ